MRIPLIPILGLSLLAAAPAHAATSSNWSGYARTGTTFRAASATWREPSVSCVSATDTDASFWVGIGGDRTGSDALEQIGTLADCAGDGVARLSAWYELVPAASRRITMTVEAGDVIRASVRLDRDRVTLALADVTRAEHVTRTLTDSDLDESSAEWIAEAPSDCAGTHCTELELADFSSVRFLASGAAGAGASTRTRITLREPAGTAGSGPLGRAGAAEAQPGTGATVLTATPSAITGTHGAFRIAYSTSGN